jgi:serine/threonine-protein kinase HipA
MPPGQEPGQDGRYVRLSPSRFEKLLEELPHRPLLAGERGIRLSLAGAQRKVALRHEDGAFHLALGALATTHILKPEIRDFEDTVRNEALCMELAGRLGLPVPKSWIHSGPNPVYVVERFDRRVGADGIVTRLHAEDFCQATGRLPSQKYQVEGGPSFADCFELVSKASANPQQDNLSLLRLAVFNALVYNADAHGKNLSLLHDGTATRLAPFYDLLSTRVYKGLETDLAMWIGGKRDANELKRRHWEGFADQACIGRREVLSVLRDLASRMPLMAAELAADQAAALGPSETIGALRRGVKHRCRLALHEVAPPSRSR